MTEQETTAFQQLAEFITKKMRMSHLYQPLMLRTLIERGGVASLREQLLDEWMKRHAFVIWTETNAPWALEKQLHTVAPADPLDGSLWCRYRAELP